MSRGLEGWIRVRYSRFTLSTINAGSEVISVWLVLFVLGTGISLLFISWASGHFAKVAQVVVEHISISFRSPYLKRYLEALKTSFEIIAAAGVSSYLSVLALTGLLESGFWPEMAKETGLPLFWSGLVIVGILTLILAIYRGDTIIWNPNLWPREQARGRKRSQPEREGTGSASKGAF